MPSPFTIAVLLTLLTIVLALVFTGDEITSDHLFAILSHWENGIWNNGLLVFAYQMMLILVLGHVLVLSNSVCIVIQHAGLNQLELTTAKSHRRHFQWNTSPLNCSQEQLHLV